MPQTRRHALWLTPRGPLAEELGRLIADLAGRHGAPVFEPHITLLGGIRGRESERIAQTRALACELKPFEITLTDADYLDEYFRCLFLDAARSEDIMAAHALAKQLLGVSDDLVFRPHLSLLYASLDAQQKEKILDRIARRFERSFLADRVALYCTEGPPPEWYCVKRFPLTGPGKAHD